MLNDSYGWAVEHSNEKQRKIDPDLEVNNQYLKQQEKDPRTMRIFYQEFCDRMSRNKVKNRNSGKYEVNLIDLLFDLNFLGDASSHHSNKYGYPGH